MRNLLAEYPAWFEPDEVQILLAAFDKAWEAVQASSIRYPADKLESVRAILAKRIIAAAVDGERDLGRLRDGALLALAQSNPASTGSWHATGGCFPLLEVGSAEPYTPFACYSHR